MVKGEKILTKGSYKDRTGQRSGAWTFLTFDHFDKHGRAHWQAICDCGVGCVCEPKNSGYSDECTHQTHTVLVARNKRWRQEKQLGRENPRFKVIEVHEGDAKERFKDDALPFKCACKICGTEKWVSPINFTRNLVGCDTCLYKSKKYGQMIPRGSTSKSINGSNIFQKWEGMVLRCANPMHHRYGDRGISVCDEWNFTNPYGFYNFFCWVSNKYPDYKDRLIKREQIDREDNDGDYTPENCRLVTPKVNAQNKSGARYTFNGETAGLDYLAERYGKVSRRTVLTRVKTLGWDLERALLTPSDNPVPKIKHPLNEEAAY